MRRIFSHSILIFVFLGLVNSFEGQTVVPTKGTEFWVGYLENFVQNGPNESLELFITGSQNTSGTVSIPQQGWSQNFSVNANGTTTVTVPAMMAEHTISEVITDRGVLVSTQDTVAVFAINAQDQTADATRIIPVDALGTEYMVASYSGIAGWGSQLVVVATTDDTELIITPTATTLGGTAPGTPITIALDAGESYQIKAADGEDLTGTTIVATEASGPCRPFAVFSGSSCAQVPSSCTACDHLFEQNFPTKYWGTRFFSVPFELATSYSLRVLAQEDATSVVIDGGTPTLINAGQWLEINGTSDVHCIEASEPVNAIQYMEGANCAGNGDPAMLFLNDADQKIDQITFSTVESTIITDHFLTVIAETDDIGSVDLDGSVIENSEFNVIPWCNDHSYAQVSITEGTHTLEAPDGITAYVYGNGFAESYAYSVGSFQGVAPIEQLVDSVICTGDSVVLIPQQDLTNVIWYAQSDTTTILSTDDQLVLYQPIVTDVYIAAGDLTISGCPDTEEFLVETPNPIILDPEFTSTQICKYDAVQLGVTPADGSDILEYSWSPVIGLDDPSAQYPIATPLNTTTYTVTATSPTGCGSGSTEVTVQVVGGNTTGVSAFAQPEAVCSGDEVQLTAQVGQVIFEDNFDPGVSWGLWCDVTGGDQASTCGSVAGNALFFSQNGPRWATTIPIDCTNGEVVSFALKVSSGIAPCDDAEPGEDIVVEYSTAGCAGPFTTFATLLESDFVDFTTVTLPIPAGALTSSTTFRIRQTSSTGPDQDTWTIDDFYVSALEGLTYDYSWSPATNVVDPQSDATVGIASSDMWFYVNVIETNSDCEYVDSIFVDVNGVSDLTVTPNTSLCTVEGFQLEADAISEGPIQWDWQPASLLNDNSLQDPVITENATETFTVTATSLGCSQFVNVTITLLEPSFELGEDIEACEGDTVTIESQISSGYSIEWSTNETSETIDVDQSGEVSAIVTSPGGCLLYDTLLVNFNPAPIADLGPDIEGCEGEQFVLDPGPEADSWQWYDGNVNQTYTVTNGGTYWVEAFSDEGCSTIDSVMVSLFPVPVIDLPEFAGGCMGESVILESGAVDEIVEWSTEENTPAITVTEPGTYAVTLTNSGGCSVSDSTEVDFFEVPDIDPGDDIALCSGESATLSVENQGWVIQWSTGEFGSEITVNESGEYTVSANNQGCSVSEAVTVEFFPAPVSMLPADTIFCFADGLPLILDAGNDGVDFFWDHGPQEQSVEVGTVGLYAVEIVNEFGCSLRDSVSVNEECEGFIYVPNSFTPDFDGINDAFFVEGSNIAEFHLEIWDRWGEKIWETDDLEEGWIGNVTGSQYFADSETFIYVVVYSFADPDGGISIPKRLEGYVTVIR